MAHLVARAAMALAVVGCAHTRANSVTEAEAVSVAAVQASSPSVGADTAAITPVVEYHAHILSAVTAAMAFEPTLAAVPVPPDVAGALTALSAAWRDKSATAALMTDNVVLYNSGNTDLPTWVLGRDAASTQLTERFARPYRITPVAFRNDGATAQVTGYISRGEGAATKHPGHVYLSLLKSREGGWLLSSVLPIFPAPPAADPITGEALVDMLDDAGIRRAVILSNAYWFGSAHSPAPQDEYAKVRAENDYVAAEVARFPDRLIAFCSFNPLREYALAELERCATNSTIRGIKLHLGSSGVDLRKPEHAEKVGAVFAAANKRKLAITMHMWTGLDYETEGRQYADVVLNKLLPLATDVAVQIAHMAGGGRSTDSALAVFGDAIAAGDPRTANLYFDVATLTGGQSAAGLLNDAKRMRQIGLKRILFGTDLTPPGPSPKISWSTFRVMMPLSDAEFRIIASNVAPYAR